MGAVASLLAMDRTTLTANLKPLERRGLVTISPDPADQRSHLLALTASGREALINALPVWRQIQAEIQQRLAPASPEQVCANLRRLA